LNLAMNPPLQDIQNFLTVATQAAEAGGKVLQSFWGKLENVQEKTPGNLVTEADTASERMVLDILKTAFPEHRILAEESGASGEITSSYVWAVDPLDGTTNYAHHFPVFSVSIGLLFEGQPIVGVVYNPITDELFTAGLGLGAFLTQNGQSQSIRVSKTKQVADSLLATGFAYDRREVKDNNYAEFCHFTQVTQGVRRLGSAALDLAYVAAGRFDGYWERGLSPWDMVAGIVLVLEAGGQVSGYDQSAINIASGRVLATNGLLHEAMSQTLSRITPLLVPVP
jgi:myo-inositol-1(or 4)-monophosphatase